MKKTLLALGSVLALLGLVVTWHFWPRVVDISAYPEPDFKPSSINRDTDLMGNVRLGYFTTGYSELPKAFLYSGGSLNEKSKTIFSGMVVQHPKGIFLFEGGVNAETPFQFDRNFDFVEKRIFKYTAEDTAKQQLLASPVKPDEMDFVLLSHLHWDHAGVIADFPKTPIWVTRSEFEWAMAHGEEHPGFFKEQYDRNDIRWDFLEFEDMPFESFDRSFDLYADGSVVLVPLDGHTAGSVGMFITLKSGQRYFFIGDTSWSAEALEIPALRPPLIGFLANFDVEEVSASVAQLHRLSKRYPDLIIVPTHDANAFKSIEKLADWQ